MDDFDWLLSDIRKLDARMKDIEKRLESLRETNQQAQEKIKFHLNRIEEIMRKY